jgi:hypothetical protein
MRTVAMAVLAGVAGLAGAAGACLTYAEHAVVQPEAGGAAGLKISPPVTKSGVTCRVTGVHATTQVQLEEGRTAHHTLSVHVQLGGRAWYVTQPSWMKTVIDDREEDVLIQAQRAEMMPEHARRQLDQSFRSLAQQEPQQTRGESAYGNLSRFPAAIMRASGVVPAVIAKRLVREEVKLEPMSEAVEIAPGVTFLLTKADRREGAVMIGYEVRVRRGREGVKPGLEPVFGGLVVRGRDGRVHQNFSYGEELVTRDEYIFVVKDAGIAEGTLREANLEVCVFDQLEEFEFAFEVANMPLAGGEGK